MRVKNVNTGAARDRVKEERYRPVREAILQVLPARGEGLRFEELVRAIAPKLPSELFPRRTTVHWYAKTVQLDLEARGLIQRVPASRPLRLLRVAGAKERKPSKRRLVAEGSKRRTVRRPSR